MSRTQGGVKRPPTIAAWALAMGLGLSMLGCADSGGLRSVWPDHPKRLGFRGREPQPSPDPADDDYARSMRSARERAGLPARRARGDASDPPRDPEDSGPPAPDDPDPAVAAEPRSPGPPRSSRPDNPGRDESIRVTLGTPEPLPTASNPPDAILASTRPPASREADPEPAPSPADRSAAPRPADRADERPGPIPIAAARPAPRRPAPAPKRSTPPASDGAAILAKSEAKLRSLGTYQVKMARVERVDGRLQPEEEVTLSVHRQPREVRLAWASGPSQGREVIYSTRVDDRSLFVHMPARPIPLPTMKMAIDSPMVTRSSRHSITEAGFDTIIESLRQSFDLADGDARGRAAYRGIEKPPGLDRPSHIFTRRSSDGESWTVFLDARSLLPSMVVAKNAAGELDEKYVYHEVVENPAELAAADAFDPDRRWGSSGGLLSRFARGGAPAGPSNGQGTMR